jgi:2,4-dienoyl-CoA reductase-like NADH-dependent reductase (Old Yellow Enzyme family)
MVISRANKRQVMSNLFKPIKIGELEIRNRFMRSATTSAYSDEQGVIRSEIVKLYENLAKGGVGLIIKGHLYVDERGKAHSGMAGLSNDYHVPKLRELTDSVHLHGAAIFAQLNFGGYQASMGERMGPSNYKGKDWTAREMTESEIWEIIESYGAAAARAVEAGFDGVQIHAAHGYLVSEFLSKHANTRNDMWGGDLSNRTRFLREVHDEIRGKIGSEIPIGMKMNCDDFSQDGFVVEEAVVVAESMANRGLNLIEVSAGGIGQEDKYRDRARSSDPIFAEASFAGACEKIRPGTRPKVLALVNGIRSISTMKALVDRGICDVISMSRPLIREPDLINKLLADQSGSDCTSCDACEALFGKEIMRCLLK